MNRRRKLSLLAVTLLTGAVGTLGMPPTPPAVAAGAGVGSRLLVPFQGSVDSGICERVTFGGNVRLATEVVIPGEPSRSRIILYVDGIASGTGDSGARYDAVVVPKRAEFIGPVGTGQEYSFPFRVRLIPTEPMVPAEACRDLSVMAVITVFFDATGRVSEAYAVSGAVPV